jgi:hypothetical protein
MVVKIPKKLEMKSLLPAPCSPLPAHVLAFPPSMLELVLHRTQLSIAMETYIMTAHKTGGISHSRTHGFPHTISTTESSAATH